ncbi:MAG: ABC transporter ATP-binding protein [Oscillospiraceae bacterium]|nr:ABC transporter ATP-binding protein [Oscillospiraceae bacterium]
MILLEQISKSYAGGKVKAVSGLDMRVKPGEIFGFIGPNGAGKTTTIKMITGVLRPDEGRVVIDGIDMGQDPIGAKGRIGYVPDSHDAYDRLTGTEYLDFIGSVYGVPLEERRARAETYLNLFELAGAAGDLVRSYSHGMKQKLLLTGALLHDPPLLLLDEPMVGLDPKAALLLKQEMRARCDRGRTVFFSTHVLEVAEKLCDRIGIIYGGKLIAVGTLAELRSGDAGASLEAMFFELTERGGRDAG